MKRFLSLAIPALATAAVLTACSPDAASAPVSTNPPATSTEVDMDKVATDSLPDVPADFTAEDLTILAPGVDPADIADEDLPQMYALQLMLAPEETKPVFIVRGEMNLPPAPEHLTPADIKVLAGEPNANRFSQAELAHLYQWEQMALAALANKS